MDKIAEMWMVRVKRAAILVERYVYMVVLLFQLLLIHCAVLA